MLHKRSCPVCGEIWSGIAVIALSHNPLLRSVRPRWTMAVGPFTSVGHPFLLRAASAPPGLWLRRRDGGKLKGIWSNHYTISSPQRPGCIHLSVCPPRSPRLTLSVLQLLFTALFSHLSFIQSLSSRFLSVFCPLSRRFVGGKCYCRVWAGGE